MLGWRRPRTSRTLCELSRAKRQTSMNLKRPLEHQHVCGKPKILDLPWPWTRTANGLVWGIWVVTRVLRSLKNFWEFNESILLPNLHDRRCWIRAVQWWQVVYRESSLDLFWSFRFDLWLLLRMKLPTLYLELVFPSCRLDETLCNERLDGEKV